MARTGRFGFRAAPRRRQSVEHRSAPQQNRQTRAEDHQGIVRLHLIRQHSNGVLPRHQGCYLIPDLCPRRSDTRVLQDRTANGQQVRRK